MKIPKFKTEAEEAKFWDTHNSVPFLDQFKETRDVQFPKPKHKSIVIDLEVSDIDAIKELAHRRHIPYHSLIQRWLKEKLSALSQ